MAREHDVLSRATMRLIKILLRVVPKSTLERMRAAAARALRQTPAETLLLDYKGTAFRLYVAEDERIAHRAYKRWAQGEEVYESVMLECLTRLLRRTERPVFMDIGAFMGHYACYAAALLADREDVFAVESNPMYFAATRRSIELNGFTRATAFNEVLSDRAGPAGVDGTAVLLSRPGDANTQSVTLDELCRRQSIRPKIAKIDVHGSEGKVLMGMRQVLSGDLEYLLLEVHLGKYLRAYSGDVGMPEILAMLDEAAFNVFYFAGHRDGDRALGSVTEGVDYWRLDATGRAPVLFDRAQDIFLLCAKRSDIEVFLAPID